MSQSQREASRAEYKTVFTIGHSTRPLEELLNLLGQHQVDCLVDVRAYPGSRTNPQYNRDHLEQAIPKAGLDYRHIRALGGRRKSAEADGKAAFSNTLWRNKSFRNYADYTLSQEFHQGLDQLLDLARDQYCALVCSEAVWWRCHRRIIADYLLSLNIEVIHIMSDHKTMPAQVTRGARIVAPKQVLYEGEKT